MKSTLKKHNLRVYLNRSIEPLAITATLALTTAVFTLLSIIVNTQ